MPANHDYDCKERGNPVLFARDHKTDCKYYIDPNFTWVSQN